MKLTVMTRSRFLAIAFGALSVFWQHFYRSFFFLLARKTSNIEKTIEERQTLVHFLFPRPRVNNRRAKKTTEERRRRKERTTKRERGRGRGTEHSAANETRWWSSSNNYKVDKEVGTRRYRLLILKENELDWTAREIRTRSRILDQYWSCAVQ